MHLTTHWYVYMPLQVDYNAKIRNRGPHVTDDFVAIVCPLPMAKTSPSASLSSASISPPTPLITFSNNKAKASSICSDNNSLIRSAEEDASLFYNVSTNL